MTVMRGWDQMTADPSTGRPLGVHPLASVGGPPEHRGWKVGDEYLQPDIHWTALVHAFCTVDGGMPYKPTTRIGDRSWLQARVHLGHNAIVGADCEICAGVVVCGEVTIGDGVHIGGGSWLKPLITVGDGAIIGGGSVVTKDVPAHEVWAGNPARFMKVAWTHPEYSAPGDHPEGYSPPSGPVPGLPVLALDHPLREPEEVWAYLAPWHRRDLGAYLAPWHRRDLEARHQRVLDEFDAARHEAFVSGDTEQATALLNKHEAASGRFGP